MAGSAIIYLNPPWGFQRKESRKNVESIIHTGTGDYVLEFSTGSREVYRTKNVRKVRMDRSVKFIDQT